MDEFESLSHSKWECKYHVVFIPKFRRKVLYGELRRHLGEVFRKLAEQRESRVEEGHLMPDHVHMMLSIPPKYAVSQVVGYIKGKSAIHLARVYGERNRNLIGQQHFWARGYFVSTIGSPRLSSSSNSPSAICTDDPSLLIKRANQNRLYVAIRRERATMSNFANHNPLSCQRNPRQGSAESLIDSTWSRARRRPPSPSSCGSLASRSRSRRSARC
jgi:putative transposase